MQSIRKHLGEYSISGKNSINQLNKIKKFGQLQKSWTWNWFDQLRLPNPVRISTVRFSSGRLCWILGLKLTSGANNGPCGEETSQRTRLYKYRIFQNGFQEVTKRNKNVKSSVKKNPPSPKTGGSSDASARACLDIRSASITPATIHPINSFSRSTRLFFLLLLLKRTREMRLSVQFSYWFIFFDECGQECGFQLWGMNDFKMAEWRICQEW